MTRGAVLWNCLKFAAATNYLYQLPNVHGWAVLGCSVGLFFTGTSAAYWISQFPRKEHASPEFVGVLPPQPAETGEPQ